MSDLYKYYDDEATEERCGLILKDGQSIECDNIHPEPEKGFEIDPEVILEHLSDLKGTWHTHPKQDSKLSGEDHLCFTQWPDLDHFVLGNEGTTLYKVQEGAVINVDHFPR